mgnify:CR=1 FL=1
MLDTKKIRQKKVTQELLDVISKSLDTTESMYKSMLKDTLKARKESRSVNLDDDDEDKVLESHAQTRYRERRLEKFEAQYLDYIMDLREAQAYISEQLGVPVSRKKSKNFEM